MAPHPEDDKAPDEPGSEKTSDPDVTSPEAEDKSHARDVTCSCPIKKSYVTITMLMLGMLLCHAQRVNIAVTVVTILDDAPHEKLGTLQAIEKLPQVMWDSRMVGFLHAIFYVGYIITQIPGGYLATIFPANRLFGASVIVSCGLNLLLPVAIEDWGYSYTCAIRAAQGLSEGLLFPTSYAIMRHWSTPEDRSRVGAVVLFGTYIGPVVGQILSGYLTHYEGWQEVYYVFGGAGIVWFVFWVLLVYERPGTHPHITEAELRDITEKKGATAIIYENDTVPWKAIMMSPPVYALYVCNFARSFVFFLLLTNEPAYINVFGFNMAQIGLLCSLPHLLMAIIALLSGPIADLMMKQPLLSRTQVRKFFTCVGFGMEAVCCLLLGLISDGTTAIIFLVIGVGFSGLTIPGWNINHLDLAPRYASVLIALSTSVGTVAGIVMPIIVGEMTQEQTIDGWQNVFFLTSGIVSFAVIFYLLFGSGELQSWADPLPHLKLVAKGSPLEKGQQPYGTFPVQVAHEKISGSDESDHVTKTSGPGSDETGHRYASHEGPSSGLQTTTGHVQEKES